MDESSRTVALTCSGGIQVDSGRPVFWGRRRVDSRSSVQIVYLRSPGEVLVTVHLCTVVTPVHLGHHRHHGCSQDVVPAKIQDCVLKKNLRQN